MRPIDEAEAFINALVDAAMSYGSVQRVERNRRWECFNKVERMTVSFAFRIICVKHGAAGQALGDPLFG